MRGRNGDGVVCLEDSCHEVLYEGDEPEGSWHTEIPCHWVPLPLKRIERRLYCAICQKWQPVVL
jgi:hypothetical protein